MASASITITITDTPQVTLIDMRDTLAALYGVNSGSNNQQKIDAIKAHIINMLLGEYQAAKNQAAIDSVSGLSANANIT